MHLNLYYYGDHRLNGLGGMGIIVLATIIFSRLFGGGIQVLQAEMPGTGITRLKPQMAQTARLLWTLYFFLTLTEVLLLYLQAYLCMILYVILFPQCLREAFLLK